MYCYVGVPTHIFIGVCNPVSDEFRLHYILQYGLYGAFLGCLLYIIFGSCKDVPMGPTAVMSLLTYQQVGQLGIYAPYYAILLCFMTGIIMVLMGILGLGKCTDFDLPSQGVLQYLPPISLVDDGVVDTASLKVDRAVIALFHVSVQMHGLYSINW